MSNMAELARAIIGGGTSPRSSEHMATVTRKAKDGTYWVHIPGGEDETPISSYLSEASEGDTVRVKISSGKAVMTGNVSSPSATIRSVSVVGSKAENAFDAAAAAMVSATDAQSSADWATESAASAATAAQNAWNKAADAETAAGLASTAAGNAQSAAETAASAASIADGKAAAAASAASAAQTSADVAGAAAHSALAQLGTVEDVLGTVNWITEHGTYSQTQDTAVDDSKVYYTRSGSGTSQDPYIYTEVAEPTDSGLSTYYELSIDTALSQYVASHLALTNAGLYVLKDNSGYKLLLTNTGMSVIDPQGNTVVTYGSSISFDSSRQFQIGNSNAYITFDGDGHISIGGSGVSIAALASYSTTAQMNNAISNAVNNIEVGDNLLRFTGDPTYVYIRTYYEDGMEPLGWYSYTSNGVYERTADGLKFTRHASASDGFVVPLVSEDSVESDVEYTISCEYRTNNASTGTIYLLCRNTPNLTATGVTLDSSGEWAKFEQTVSWTIADNKKPYALLFPYFGGDGKWFEVKRGTLKMEKGTSATPWMPAKSDYTHPLDNSQPNLCPYLSIPVTDTSYWWAADGRGEPVSNTEGIDQVLNLEDGWAHVLLDARSESGNENKSCYLNLQIAAGKLRDKIKPGKTYTWMIEVKNLTITDGKRLHVCPSAGDETYDIFTNTFYQGDFTQDGVQYVPVKSFDEFPQDNRDTRGYIWVGSGTYAECDVRVSLYEGVYTGLYKPYSGKLVYVPSTSNSGIATAVQQIYIQSESYGVDMPSGWVNSYAESVSEDNASTEWTAKHPTFNPSYPLIYTATQTMMLDGTVETTTPVLDDTTTVIDGGSIITGSVTANALAANSVQVGNLSQDVSDLIAEAAKTATGYLAYDGNALTIGEQNSPIKAKLTNTKFSFMGGDEGNTELAYMGQNPDTNAWETVFDQARVSDMLFFGGFAWIKRDNGNMSLKWVG